MGELINDGAEDKSHGMPRQFPRIMSYRGDFYNSYVDTEHRPKR